MKTRVLLLIPTLDRSGAEKQLTLLATGLPRDEFDVRVVCLTRGGPYQADLERAQVPCTVLGKRGKFDLRTWWRLKRILAQWRPDVLHTWLFAANAYGRLAAGRRPRCAVVVSERCVDSWKAGWQLWLDRRLAGRTTRLVANSEAVAEFYRREVRFPAQRTTVIRNGVPIPAGDASVREAVRNEWGLAADEQVLLYVGRLAAQKRVKDLLWALELLRVLKKPVRLLIAGDGPERGALEEFAQQVRIDDRVRFLGPREDIERILQGADLFWLASGFEGQSNSLMEAMSMGLPVVVSDIAPNRELVTAGETGYLFPVGDRVALAQVTERLLDNEAERRRVGEAARATMERAFGVGRMVAEYAMLYRESLVNRS